MDKATLNTLVQHWCTLNLPPVQQLDQTAWKMVTEKKAVKNIDEDGYYSVHVKTLLKAVEQEPTERRTYKEFNEWVGIAYASDLPDFEVIFYDFNKITELIEKYIHESSKLEGRYVVDMNEDDEDIDVFYMEES